MNGNLWPSFAAIVENDGIRQAVSRCKRIITYAEPTDDSGTGAQALPRVTSAGWSQPGDHARLLSDGSSDLVIREARTVNSTTTRVLAEERVKQALAPHSVVPGALALVVGRPVDESRHRDDAPTGPLRCLEGDLHYSTRSRARTHCSEINPDNGGWE